MTPCTMRAADIRPCDLVDGKRVVWAIQNYLRNGKTEVKFDDGETKFLNNDKPVAVAREAAN